MTEAEPLPTDNAGVPIGITIFAHPVDDRQSANMRFPDKRFNMIRRDPARAKSTGGKRRFIALDQEFIPNLCGYRWSPAVKGLEARSDGHTK